MRRPSLSKRNVMQNLRESFAQSTIVEGDSMTEGKSDTGNKVILGAGILSAAILLATRRAKAEPNSTDEALLTLLAAIGTVINNINATDTEILNAIKAIVIPPGGELPPGTPPPVEKMSEVIRFGRAVLPATGVRIYETILFKARVTNVIIHFPPGCNGLVDVSVYRAAERILPREGAIALNNVTLVYDFGVGNNVDDGVDIMVDIANADAVWPHTITVTTTVEER